MSSLPVLSKPCQCQRGVKIRSPWPEGSRPASVQMKPLLSRDASAGAMEVSTDATEWRTCGCRHAHDRALSAWW